MILAILTWRPSWILELNDFSNSESLSLSDASIRFWVIQLTVWEMSFEEFQNGGHGGTPWILERNNFSNSESLCRSNASHQVSAHLGDV